MGETQVPNKPRSLTYLRSRAKHRQYLNRLNQNRNSAFESIDRNVRLAIGIIFLIFSCSLPTILSNYDDIQNNQANNPRTTVIPDSKLGIKNLNPSLTPTATATPTRTPRPIIPPPEHQS